jgi:hypothetical protein
VRDHAAGLLRMAHRHEAAAGPLMERCKIPLRSPVAQSTGMRRGEFFDINWRTRHRYGVSRFSRHGA